eukprot:CAMPEP_0197902754 /NCGR_PEP_ID=MMETSP1439-20131203/54236_1 /TAXON_ID=66791 /ORGANISM="Gonyaulax spinifera, Strain CCMP409" /LENGTH=41 /DNA_ID= /DNA_START= /DNA_END= /DNA_ORIENTATION=
MGAAVCSRSWPGLGIERAALATAEGAERADAEEERARCLRK